jgi:hypothetical protein
MNRIHGLVRKVIKTDDVAARLVRASARPSPGRMKEVPASPPQLRVCGKGVGSNVVVEIVRHHIHKGAP